MIATCVTGAAAGGGPLDVQYQYTNSTGIDRSLYSLTLVWPWPQPNMLTSVDWGGMITVQVWAGVMGGSPLTIPNGDPGWTGASRVITNGTSRTLRLDFGFPVAAGDYILTTQWDDTLGGNLCTSAPVTVTHP